MPPSGLVWGGAFLLDRLIADPWDWFHPVQAMGWTIASGTQLLLQIARSPRTQRLGGGLLTLLLLVGSYLYAAGAIAACDRVHAWLGMSARVILTASCLGARSLHLAALSVLEPLERGHFEEARTMLGRYVGRDTDALDEREICRATIETVAENTPDGATAPLLFAAIGGAPLAFAYKALSTLDSMVGYHRQPYTHFGTIPARLEDAMTWLPCRLTVFTLALHRDRPFEFWRRCHIDARRDPSPNSGWSEAAFAWSLGVRLGGTNLYRGVPRIKPYLGPGKSPLTPATVRASLKLMQQTYWTWMGIVLGCYVAKYGLQVFLLGR
ncbi:MAG: adenosylcobinamide-phosphate synthase CbiB [Cyanobacteria bacterium J06642_2]